MKRSMFRRRTFNDPLTAPVFVILTFKGHVIDRAAVPLRSHVQEEARRRRQRERREEKQVTP